MSMFRNGKTESIVLAIACNLAASCNAQWRSTVIHPPGAGYSSANGVSDRFAAGQVEQAGTYRAGGWDRGTNGWIDLHPSAATQSGAWAAFGDQQGGFVTIEGRARASLWRGSRDSWIDLSPPGAGAFECYVHGLNETQQVGSVRLGVTSPSRASLWTGSAASWIDLTPSVASQAAAFGVSGDEQVGYARINHTTHASLWRGTAESWVDLDPDSDREGDSSCFDVSNGQQVGSVYRGGDRACLWSGSASTRIDLHPQGAIYSCAYATVNEMQAGFACLNGADRACVWRGSSASWVDLHALLPERFESSVALGLFRDGGITRVAGCGVDASGRTEALLWTLCHADFDGNGQLDFFDYLDFAQAFDSGDGRADFDGNGQVDFFDYLEFVAAFDAGCD